MNISINAVKDFNQSNIATLPNDRIEEVEKIISENPEFNKITNVLIAISNNQYFIGDCDAPMDRTYVGEISVPVYDEQGYEHHLILFEEEEFERFTNDPGNSTWDWTIDGISEVYRIFKYIRNK